MNSAVLNCLVRGPAVALALLIAPFAAVERAQAACDPKSPVNNATVICTGTTNNQNGTADTQLNNTRALKSDAEAEARLIREMLQGGRPNGASEVPNSELIRRLSEQRATLRAQLAGQS